MSDDDDAITFFRKRKHNGAQARSAARRKKRNAPRRDDLARAGYYVLLLTVHEAEARGEIEQAMRIRRRVGLILEDACFDPQDAGRHTPASAADMK